MENIPKKLLYTMLSILDLKELVNFCKSCKKYSKILYDDLFWHFKLKRDYPKLDTKKETKRKKLYIKLHTRQYKSFPLLEKNYNVERYKYFENLVKDVKGLNKIKEYVIKRNKGEIIMGDFLIVNYFHTGYENYGRLIYDGEKFVSLHSRPDLRLFLPKYPKTKLYIKYY